MVSKSSPILLQKNGCVSALALAVTICTSFNTQAAEKIHLGIGGYFHVFTVAGRQSDSDGEPGADRRNHFFTEEGEIHFLGHTVLENGLKIGVNVQLEAETCVDQVDESYVYVQGGFGRLEAGSNDPASDSGLHLAPRSPLPGHGFEDPTFKHWQTGGNSIVIPQTAVSITRDSTKLTYYTPRVAGLQAGLSYTPTGCKIAVSVSGCGGSYAGFPNKTNTNRRSEAIEGIVNYRRKFGDFEFAGALAYGEATIDSTAPGRDNVDQMAGSLRLRYRTLTTSFAYKTADRVIAGNAFDRTDFLAGISYKTGSLTYGAQYVHVESDNQDTKGEDELDAIELGLRHRFGPGVTLSGGVQWIDLTDNNGNAANENEAIIFIVGTTVTF